MKPTKAQAEYFSKCFGCCRFVYNHALQERKDAYASNKKSMRFYDQCASLLELRKTPEYAWLNEVSAMSLKYALLNLDNAYNLFFKKKSKFPKFKSKKNRHDSVKFAPNRIHYDFNKYKVRIPKLGWVALCKNKPFDQSIVKIYSTTVSRDACGEFWCTVSIEDGVLLRPKAKVCKETSVGIDVGIKHFAVLSNGEKYANMRFSETEDKRIERARRGLSRKQKWTKVMPASNRYERYRIKLAKIHRRVANRRKDYLNKISTDIVRKYNTICIEDLNVKGMMRNHSLAGAISSVSWSSFIQKLQYKSDMYGVNLLKAGRFDPTSQICSSCGCRNTNTKDLSVREWICPECGAHHDRDVNAAKNILAAAIYIFNNQSPAVTGITDVDGADSENNAGTGSRVCDYASDETSIKSMD